MTAYLIKVLDEDPALVTIVYSICSITAPIPGAATGGYFADKNVIFCLLVIICIRVVTKERTYWQQSNYVQHLAH